MRRNLELETSSLLKKLLRINRLRLFQFSLRDWGKAFCAVNHAEHGRIDRAVRIRNRRRAFPLRHAGPLVVQLAARNRVMRIRDIARIGGFPCGEYNAVTDVKGVRVGHSTVIKDGAGPVEGIARTGVTVVLPAGDIVENAMYAGVFSLNGNGELSGCHWIEESGLLTTPIALTNTHSPRHRARRHDSTITPASGRPTAPRTGCFRS